MCKIHYRQRLIADKTKDIEKGKKAGSLSYADEKRLLKLTSHLTELKVNKVAGCNAADAFKVAKADFDGSVKNLKKMADAAGKKLSNVFNFCDDVFPDGQELLIPVTELTISKAGAMFISRYGCKEYFEHNKELLFYERRQEIIMQLDALELDKE